jgi:phage terminase large subunit-like protein
VTAALRPSLGKFVCAWIEKYLVHGEGDYLGKPFVLEPWQRRFIFRLYELGEDGRRIVRRALLILPKGCGKTELIAAIGLAELCGPTAFAEGRPSRRLAPNIPVAAASYEQADRLFAAAKTMAVEGKLRPFVEPYDTELRLANGEMGRMFRVAAVAGTNDGGLPTCFLADEIHEWVGRKDRVHLVIGNSLAKRADGLELNISTPDDADPHSLLGKLVAYGERVNAGEVDDATFLYERWSAPENVDLNDRDALREAIRACHPASWVDPERVAARWEIDRVPEHEFRRYHLAQFVRSSAKWLPANAWTDCTDSERNVEDGEEIVLGFDGSYDNDATALIGCTMDGHVFTVGVWERPVDAHNDWVVPREAVKAKVAEAMERWHVRELACDPPGWHREIDEWSDTYGETVVVYQTNRRATMSDACSRFYSAVVKGDLTHDGSDVLARHLTNAVVKETPDGAYITKDGRKSPRKIDAAVAAVIAFDRATQPVAEPFLMFV